MTIFSEEKKRRELKEKVRIMNSQTNDTEKSNLIEDGKKIAIDEVIKLNGIIHKSLES